MRMLDPTWVCRPSTDRHCPPGRSQYGYRHTYPVSQYGTEMRHKRDARDHVKRARSRPAASPCTASISTMDLATQAYSTITTCDERAQPKWPKAHHTAHDTNDRGGSITVRRGRPTGPNMRLSTDIHPMSPGGQGAVRCQCHCSYPAALSSWIATVARPRPDVGESDGRVHMGSSQEQPMPSHHQGRGSESGAVISFGFCTLRPR